jgi:tetratricopeptide (TPR) repeat protein
MSSIIKLVFISGLIIFISGCDWIPHSEQDYLQRAGEYIKKDDPSAASIELKKALQKNPNNPESRFLLGRQLLKLNNLDAAAAQFEKAEKGGYDKNKLQLPRAKIYLYQSKYKELVENIFVPEQLGNKDKSELTVIIGEAYLHLNNKSMASELFTRARSIDLNTISVCLAPVRLELDEKQFVRAEKDVIACSDKFPESSEGWYLRGLIDKYKKHIEKAAAAFKQAIKLEPENYVSRIKLVSAVELAHIQIMQGSTVEAEKTLRLIASQFRHPVIPYVKAINRYQKKEYEAAIKYLDQSLKINEKYIPALSLLAIINQERGDTSQAQYYTDLVRRLGGSTKNIESIKKYLEYQNLGEGDYASLGSGLEQDKDRALAQIYKQQDADKAVAELEAVLEKDKGNLKANVLLAFAYLKAGKKQSAIDQIRNVVEQHKDSPMAYSAMGVIYSASGDLGSAEQSLQKALKIDPNYKPALLNLARLKIKSNHLRQAQVFVDRVLSIDSRNEQAVLLKVFILGQSGKKAESIKLLEEYVKANPDARLAGLLMAQHYLNTGNLNGAEKQARIILDNNVNNRFAAIILGRVKYRQNKLAEAKKIFSDLHQKQPGDYIASYYLGKIAKQGGDMQSAVSHFSEAIQSNQKFYMAMAELASIYMQTRKYQEAARIAQDVISFNPEIPLGYILEGDNNFVQKKYKNSSVDYRKALLKQPANGLIAIKIFNVDRKLYGNKKAQQTLKTWLGKHDNIAARIVLASSYQESGALNAALNNYQAILKIQQNNVIALNNVAWIYYRKGHIATALQYANKAHKLAPERPEVNDTLGWILVAEGKYKQALSNFDSAIAKMPDNPSIQYHQAYTLYRLGRKTEAKRILQQLLAEQPEFDERSEAQKLLNRI